MIRLSILCLLIFLSALSSVRAQWVLPLAKVLEQVELHHPVMYRARLISASASAKIMAARGNFDPYIQSGLESKQYETKEYFTLLDAKLYVPTWFGINVFGGYEYNQGSYIDPSRTLPADGLFSAGLGFSAGDLWFDKRRNILRQAQLMGQAAEAEMLQTINALFLQVCTDYWDWAVTWQERAVYTQARMMAENQLQFVRNGYLLGERPATDTLEAMLQYRNMETAWMQAGLKYEQARMKLETHLWLNGEIPLEMDSTLVPESPALAMQLPALLPDSVLRLTTLTELHNPELQIISFQIHALEFEKKYKTASLIPKLDIYYNFLYSEKSPVWLTDNYKLGVKFKTPLLFRNERGEQQQARIQVEQARFKQREMRVQTLNRLKTAIATYQNLHQQLRILDDMAQQYEQLRDAERVRFENGESTVFLVNAREMASIQARIRLAEMQGKILQISRQIRYMTGEK